MSDKNQRAEVCTALFRAWGVHPNLTLGEFLHEFVFPPIRVTVCDHSFELRAPKACSDNEVLTALRKAMQ